MSPAPRTVVLQHPLVVAVVGALTFDTFLAYDTEAPAVPPFPYSVVYSLDDAETSGPMWDGQADVRHEIQVTCVGETVEQARKLQDKNRAQMLGDPPFAVIGRSIQLVDLDAGGSVERDEAEQPRLFYSVDIWMIYTTPA